MSSDPIKNLPSPVENAATIAKLVSTAAAAFTAVWYPSAGIAAALLPIIVDQGVERLRKILLQELKKADFRDLSAEQIAPLFPMTYKLLEAAKEGEYKHNLRVLAAYLTGELKQKIPDAAAGNFSRMVERVKGLSDNDLKVMALIDIWLSTIVKPPTDERPRFVSPTGLTDSPHNKGGLAKTNIQESLQDLAARGFLIPDGATRMNKSEEFYRTSQSFADLMDRARDYVARPDDAESAAV